MAWWMAEEAAKLGGFAFYFGDDKSEDEDADEMTGGKGGWEQEYLGDDADFVDSDTRL